MKKIIALIILIVNLSISLVSCSFISDIASKNSENKQKNNLVFTNSIEDFNSENYPLNDFDVFLCGIPNNAKPIQFHYRKLFGMFYDISLELKFDSPEEIDLYVDSIKQAFLRRRGNELTVQGNGWALEEPNPYNEKYTDLFLTYHADMEKYYYYIGYQYASRLKYEEGEYTKPFVLYADFQSISYSYDELTVILFYCDTNIDYTSNDYFYIPESYCPPQYFLRFNIPMDKEINRIFVLNFGY